MGYVQCQLVSLPDFWTINRRPYQKTANIFGWKHTCWKSHQPAKPKKKRTSSFLVFLSASLNLQGSSEFQCLNSKYHKSNELGLCLMSPKEKRTSPKEFEQTHQVHIYICICICTYTAPFLGCDVWKHPPPSQEKGWKTTFIAKTKLWSVEAFQKHHLFDLVFFVDVDSTWDTSLPKVVGNFPPWFNIHSTRSRI